MLRGSLRCTKFEVFEPSTRQSNEGFLRLSQRSEVDLPYTEVIQKCVYKRVENRVRNNNFVGQPKYYEEHLIENGPYNPLFDEQQIVTEDVTIKSSLHETWSVRGIAD